LASERNATGEVTQALAAFQRLLGESADLRRLVESPVFSAAEQVKALDAVLSAARIGGITANFIRLVATNVASSRSRGSSPPSNARRKG